MHHNDAVDLFGRCSCACHGSTSPLPGEVRPPLTRDAVLVDPAGTEPAGSGTAEAEAESARPACWCKTRNPDPFLISHNDRVRYLHGCQCRARRCINDRTHPAIRRLLDDRSDAERERRIASGRLRSSDISHIARHPQRYPHFFRGR